MVGIISKPDTTEKLKILTEDAQYDLACACGTDKNSRRQNKDGKWIYPITLPNGGTSVLFKTLISNVCANDCKYCPLRSHVDINRCTLSPEETANVFLDYYYRRKVFGLFLSSGLSGSADAAMQRLNTTAKILRQKHKYKGYIHLKILPGASDAAIEEAVSLSTAVSLNIETPGEKNLAKLSKKKRYIPDIIEPIKLISRLTARGSKYSRCKQTTQFIVGAADESDAEIVKYTAGLYDRLNMNRVYFSAYQKNLGDEVISTQDLNQNSADTLKREHRLYQVDFLFRKYGFTNKDIIFDENDRLSLTRDPKETWALNHLENFPVKINSASKFELLKVPGLGPITVNRILKFRTTSRIRRIDDIGKPGLLLRKASKYLTF